ncbi:septum site-determining protein MinC [Ramlibacter albus]|uniref:Probable septum site-determining protein MinC n=1 Tax=Ramlibacter albus TaxID=2079448 RepID=A0A923M6P6_9BURK|nr:septum site-determining protein MinC [Ramlibacter albus]MBC5763781.1 septum site-determining protein MinC [Ramlibacter albus]
MSVSLAGKAPATFEIKSANLPLVALLLKSTDLARLADELAQRFGDIPDFFDGDPLLVDLSPLQGAGDVDFAQLKALLTGYRLSPVAVKGGSQAHTRAAQREGFVEAGDAGILHVEREAAPEEKAPEPTVVQVPTHALVVDKPLRSGQQVYAKGRDLVVLAMVNPGAEVIADGNVHVYAPLRGKAIAGARGNTEARIFTLSLDPELVSIAGVYRTSEAPLPPDLRGKPAQIHLASGDKLVMQPLRN